jgi:hypothetical protein
LCGELTTTKDTKITKRKSLFNETKKEIREIRTFVYFVQLRGELNHATLKPYLPDDPHKSAEVPFVETRASAIALART